MPHKPRPRRAAKAKSAPRSRAPRAPSPRRRGAGGPGPVLPRDIEAKIRPRGPWGRRQQPRGGNFLPGAQRPGGTTFTPLGTRLSWTPEDKLELYRQARPGREKREEDRLRREELLRQMRRSFSPPKGGRMAPPLRRRPLAPPLR